MMAEWPTLALYWYAPAGAAGAVDPIFGRPLTFYLFTLPAWQLVAGWLMTLAVIACAMAVFFIVITGGSRMLASGPPRRRSRLGLARPVGGVRGLAADARGARVSRALRAALRRPHDLRRRHLHRRARHAHRAVDRLHRARPRRGDGGGQRRLGAAPALAHRGGRAGGGLLPPGRRLRLVHQQLHRQAERAGARAALHREQHRDDAPGVRAQPHRAAAVSRRHRHRGDRRRQQPGDAAEHPPVGLARAAGHAAADSGDPDLLRLPGHRHRSLRDRRIGAADDARHARAERREAAGEQPQLDQREADLHPRLRRDDEPGERLHARRAAAARAEQHAGPEHDHRASASRARKSTSASSPTRTST